MNGRISNLNKNELEEPKFSLNPHSANAITNRIGKSDSIRIWRFESKTHSQWFLVNLKVRLIHID